MANGLFFCFLEASVLLDEQAKPPVIRRPTISGNSKYSQVTLLELVPHSNTYDPSKHLQKLYVAFRNDAI